MFSCGYENVMRQMAEEYCWAITEAVGRSCCGPSCSGELQFGLQLDSLIAGYNKRNRHFQCCIETKLLMI